MTEKIKLSEDLKKWRAERPDELTMDRFIRKAEELERITSDNSDYAKCLDELWKHIELNAKNGSFMKSSIAKILSKHFV